MSVHFFCQLFLSQFACMIWSFFSWQQYNLWWQYYCTYKIFNLNDSTIPPQYINIFCQEVQIELYWAMRWSNSFRQFSTISRNHKWVLLINHHSILPSSVLVGKFFWTWSELALLSLFPSSLVVRPPRKVSKQLFTAKLTLPNLFY